MVPINEAPRPAPEVYELRVHGVSGTPPESALGVPAVRRVAGDATAGFYRQQLANGQPVGAENGRLVEAYSWGGLTSGGFLRPLWLLLTPFMLVNVAMFTAAAPLTIDRDYSGPPSGAAGGSSTSPDAVGPGLRSRGVRRSLEAGLRLLALLMTLTAVAAVISPVMDVVGFQYVRGSRDLPGWLFFLNWSWLSAPHRRFAVAALVPLAFIALLWWLAQKSWKNLESAPVPAAHAQEVCTPLEDRSMWNGESAVRRLRAVHVTAALGFLAIAVLLPLWRGARPLARWDVVWHRPAGPLVVVLTVVAAVVVLACLVLAVAPAMSRRETPGTGSDEKDGGRVRRWFRTHPRPDRYAYAALPWLGLALVVGAELVVFFGSSWSATLPAGASGGLPGWSDAVQILLTSGAVSLVLVAAAALRLRWGPMGADYPHSTEAKTDGSGVTTSPAWGGLAPAALPLLGWLLLTGWAAGLTFTVARILGTPRSSAEAGAPTDLVIPAAFTWSAAVAFAVAAVVLVLGLVLGPVLALRWCKPAALADGYPGRQGCGMDTVDLKKREQAIARSWQLATLDRSANRAITVLLPAAALAALAAVVVYWLDRAWPSKRVPSAVVLGTWALAAVAAWLIALGRRAFKDQALRRKIGILWDLGAFWPRSAHPLAPPCYMERVMPDLLRRMGAPEIAGSRAIVLSCHSQGTVIGAAFLMQTAIQSGKLRFLSYGSPLHRLYAAVFPAYFGRVPLGRLGQFLSTEEWHEGLAFDDGPEARRSWQWCNLYRPTDPIGGPLFADYREHSPDLANTDQWDVDVWLWDPVFDRATGDPCFPATHGHSDYPSDPAYEVALGKLTGGRERATATVRLRAMLSYEDAAVGETVEQSMVIVTRSDD